MRLLSRYRRKRLLPLILLGILFVALSAGMYYLIKEQAKTPILIFMGLYAFCLLVNLLRTLLGIGSKSYRRYLANLPPEQQEQLDRQYTEGMHFYQAVLTDRCLVVMTGSRLEAIPYEEMVWIYEAAIQNNGYGGTTKTMIIVTKDKKKHAILMRQKDEKTLCAFLDGILLKNPGVVLGYDMKTADLFKKDFPKLLEKVRQKQNVILPEESIAAPPAETTPPEVPEISIVPEGSEKTETAEPSLQYEESVMTAAVALGEPSSTEPLDL